MKYFSIYSFLNKISFIANNFLEFKGSEGRFELNEVMGADDRSFDKKLSLIYYVEVTFFNENKINEVDLNHHNYKALTDYGYRFLFVIIKLNLNKHFSLES